jgi:hypothetical protein
MHVKAGGCHCVQAKHSAQAQVPCLGNALRGDTDSRQPLTHLNPLPHCHCPLSATAATGRLEASATAAAGPASGTACSIYRHYFMLNERLNRQIQRPKPVKYYRLRIHSSFYEVRISKIDPAVTYAPPGM